MASVEYHSVSCDGEQDDRAPARSSSSSADPGAPSVPRRGRSFCGCAQPLLGAVSLLFALGLAHQCFDGHRRSLGPGAAAAGTVSEYSCSGGDRQFEAVRWPAGLAQGCPRGSFEYSADWLAPRGLPARERWQDIFDGLAAGSREREGRLLSFGRLSQFGVTSRLNNFVNEVLVAMYTETPLTLCAPEGVRDTWSLHFEGVGFAQTGECDWPGVWTSNCTEIQPKPWIAGAGASGTLDTPAVAELKRFLYRRLFRLNKWAREEEALLLMSLGLMPGTPFVGVHVRRGDKEDLGEIDVEVGLDFYAAEVRRQCADTGAAKVFVASDSTSVAGELQGLLPELEVVQQERLPDDAYSIRNKGLHDKEIVETAERNLIMDLAFLIRSDVFVGTASSNIGRFVFFMREEERPSISLDDGNDFLLRNC